jgi:3-hydroxyisobutyrate dehydrogenase-like beta-hydroxyacid dehydrogenase
MVDSVGVIGLGIMGGAMSANLIDAGFRVTAYDIDATARDRLAGRGGSIADSPGEVAQKSEILITSLPSPEALDDVVNGPTGLIASGRKGLVVIETSTLTIEDKQRACEALAKADITMLDSPLSGTGAQAVTKDLLVYVSGDRAAFDRIAPVLDGFARGNHYVGAFGNGSKMKFVANLLVAIHNVAAAEALLLGMKAGLDPQVIYDVIAGGAGASRMFQVRGPMMVADDYDDATMKMDVWQKDMKIIGEFARMLDSPTPLFSASAEIYKAGMGQGRAKQDTASVCGVLEEIAKFRREKS